MSVTKYAVVEATAGFLPGMQDDVCAVDDKLSARAELQAARDFWEGEGADIEVLDADAFKVWPHGGDDLPVVVEIVCFEQ